MSKQAVFVTLGTISIFLVPYVVWNWRQANLLFQDIEPNNDVIKTVRNDGDDVIPPSDDFPSNIQNKHLIKKCEDIIHVLGINSSYDNKYTSDFEAFHKAFVNAMVNADNLEGNTGCNPYSMVVLRSVVAKPWIKTVCETGFNAGHSSFNWLTANRNLKVFSFDLGAHKYSRPMAAFLKKHFVGRFAITWGDSRETLKPFRLAHPEVTCDLMLVDGGHFYSVARNDIKQFSAMASKRNIVILDDYPTGWGQAFGKAWEEEKNEGNLAETFRCHFRFQEIGIPSDRGLTFGHFIKET